MDVRVCQRPGCGRPIGTRRRRDARWCSRSCESKARRQAARKATFEAANPGAAELLGAEDQSLAELQDRARVPAHWSDIEAGRVDPDLSLYSDAYDVGVYENDQDDDDQDEDDETGIVVGGSAPDPFEERNKAWAERQAFANAINAVQEDFDRKAGKYIEQQKRNAGTIRPELAALTRERDNRIAELTREHHLAQAYEWAAKDRPGRLVTAHERAVEQAAARSFAMDLGRGRFLRSDPADAGRDVHDAWIW